MEGRTGFRVRLWGGRRERPDLIGTGCLWVEPFIAHKGPMSAARRQRAFGAIDGWRSAAARTLALALALVLSLALALPPAGLAEDLAFHGGTHAAAPSAQQVPVLAVAAPGPQAPDPGLACHAHCGCHLVASPCEAASAPPPASARRAYAWTRETASSVFPDRLPRPPRA